MSDLLNVNQNTGSDSRKVALIGGGSVAGPHLRAMALINQSIGAVQLVDFASRDERVLTGDFYRPFNWDNKPGPKIVMDGITAHKDWKRMLRQTEAQLVFVLASTNLHHQMVLAALKAGKDVFVEKPLTRTVAEAKEILAVCTSTGMQCFVGHIVEFIPGYTNIGDLLFNRTRQNSVQSVNFRRLVPWSQVEADEKKNSGVVFDGYAADLGIHEAGILAQNVRSIQVKESIRYLNQIQYAKARVVLTNNAMINIEIGASTKVTSFKADFSGIRMDGSEYALREGVIVDGNTSSVLTEKKPHEIFAEEQSLMLRALNTNSTIHGPLDLSRAVAAIEIMEAMHKSIDAGGEEIRIINA